MRTLSFSQKPTYSKNMVHHHDIPTATTRLPGGVASGCLAGSKLAGSKLAGSKLAGSKLAGSKLAGSCYVIEEETPIDGQIDDNGNNQRSELDTSCGNNRLAEGNFAGKGIDNIVTNSDSNVVNHSPAQLFHSCNSVREVNRSPLSKNLSPVQCLFSNRSHDRVDMSPQLSNKTSGHDPRHQHATGPPTSDVKSGNLLLIIPEHKANIVNPKSDSSFLSSPRSLPRRCPVIVKIYDKGFEKYAIISSTRRQSTFSPFCLKLKHSYVTQSASNPSCFTVVIDSSEGKTFNFEASSPDVAREWMQAFAHTDSSLHWSTPTKCPSETSGETTEQTQVTNSKCLHVARSLSNVPLLPVLSESIEEGDEE